MTEQVWNFGQISSGSGELHSFAAQAGAVHDQGLASLAAISGVWGGMGSDSYTEVQNKWNESHAQLNDALMKLAATVGQSGDTMLNTETGIAGSF